MSDVRRGRLLSLAALAVIAAAGAWGVLSLEVETDITHFLPPADDPRLTEVTRAVASSDLNRTVTLTIEAPDADVAARAARDLADRLRARRGIAWVRGGTDEDLERAFYELYFPRRLGFVSDDPERIGQMLGDDALRERARELRERLGSPMGPLIRRIAPEDPWLLFPRHLERLREAMSGSLRVHDGAFVTEDGRYAVVWLATERSPFDTAAAAEIGQAIQEDFAAVNRAHGGALSLEQSSVHRIALASERQVREDVTRVSVAGTIGVLLFLVLIFGSPRYVVLGTAPLAVGVAAAVAVSAAVFGRVHGLTLAFGATLIGVAVDYVAHSLNHHVLAPDPAGPAGTMRRIWPGLALGGLTTVAGVAALGWTGYPAIREMALFTSSGVLAALVATRAILPSWLPRQPRPTRLHSAITRAAARAIEALGARRAVLWSLPVLAFALIAAGGFRLETRDDPQALAAADPALVAEDERVRSRVARVDAGRFVVAFGDDLEAALQVNDRVHAALEDARAAGEIDTQRSLHVLLWSADLQRRNLDAVLAIDDLAARTERAYAAEGFVEGAFAPFLSCMGDRSQCNCSCIGTCPPCNSGVLGLGDLSGSALGAMVAPFVVEVEGGVAVLTFLHGVGDEEAVAARVAGVEGAALFDQSEYLSQAYGAFRARTFELLAIGVLVVVALVAVRYRSVRATVAAVAPAVLAGAGSLAFVALLGEPLTLVHAVTVLLVLSMGVDYGVFMVESAGAGEGPTPTVVSLLVACVSTVLSFGALALSSHPAMRAIGTTTAAGIGLSLVLAPAAWLLVRPRRRPVLSRSSRRRP